MGAIIAAIIGGVVAIGTSVVGGVAQNNAIEEANKEAEMLANKQGIANDKIRQSNERLQKYQIGMDRKRFKFEKSQAKQAKKERGIERSHRFKQDYFNQNLNIVNQDAGLRNNFLNTIQRAA